MQEILLGLGRSTPEELTGDARFYGEVTTEALIDGVGLASTLGLTAGTAQNTTEPWLAFELDGKLLLVAKKTYRHSVSWDHINSANAVYGSRSVDIHGSSYRIRLLKGAASDPISGGSGENDPEQGWGSEWNRLMYPLVPSPVDVPTHPLSQEGIRYGEWASYTEAELNIGISSGNGRYTWCQESSGPSRVHRGAVVLSRFRLNGSSISNSTYGWRPVLELVRTTEQPQDIFLGETPTTQLITGTDLASQIGLTAGTAQHDDSGWLKFLTREGKTLYVAKKPYRHSISWNNINSRGLRTGNTTTVIDGKTYKVRLLTGLGGDNEWDRIFYPVHNNIYTSGNPVPGYWPIYSDIDLAVTDGQGSRCHCQEQASWDSARSTVRGGSNIRSSASPLKELATDYYGWRPVLELVE